ncbi:hypothetical protein Bca4012_048036 [Brassica carinata]|uniref:Uncharacterized protein n=1 Tax=Brassica carinata TaxID=52824 RepID=A0A8X7R8N9_BRACI|nr:hypothetical protein Bca52824_056018 [Brassica carinata]
MKKLEDESTPSENRNEQSEKKSNRRLNIKGRHTKNRQQPSRGKINRREPSRITPSKRKRATGVKSRPTSPEDKSTSPESKAGRLPPRRWSITGVGFRSDETETGEQENGDLSHFQNNL